LTSPETIEATEMYIKLLKDAGPSAAQNLGWYECLTSFQQGKAATLLDVNVWMPAFQDPAKSVVAGKVGCAVIPATKGGYRQAAGGASWMLAMPKAGTKKEQAWQFIKWLTSKEMAWYMATKAGEITRNSTWTNEAFLKANPYKDWITASMDTTVKYGKDYYLPSYIKMGAMGELVDIALQNIYMGNSAQKEMEAAKVETEKLLK
jgi:multiple sugar transport system substrate-binding protein